MAKFKFRLQTLLRLRDTARDERRGELAEAYRADEILRRQRRQIEEALDELSEQSRAAAQPGAVNVDRLLDARRYELVLKSQQQLTDQQQQALDAEIERRRQALVEANRQVRVLEILRERQQQRHRREESRQEIKELDDVASRRTVEEDAR